MSWPAVCQEAQKYADSLQRLNPRYFEEIKGIADGAGVGILDIIALNVRTEITFGLFTEDPKVPVKSDGCTAVAVRDVEGKMLLAQNWDWQVEQGPNLFIYHVSQPGTGLPDFVTVTEAGVIGKIGFNSKGVGVCLNAIRERGVNPEKLPIHVALRTCLESESLEKAVSALKAVGTAGSGHILVSDPHGATGLECTSTEIKELGLSGSGIVHTNHFIHDDLFTGDLSWLPDSHDRFQRMQEMLGEKTSSCPASSSLLFELFKDEHGGDGGINRRQAGVSEAATLFNIIMDLSKKEAIVTVGRPTEFSEQVKLSL